MIPILPVEAVREFEEQFISSGIASAEELMEKAGEGAAASILREFPRAREALFLIGKGNNGGDGLVIARYLARAGWRVTLAIPHHRKELGPLCGKKLDEFRAEFASVLIGPIAEGMPWPSSDGIVVDALLGIGARGPLRPDLLAGVALVNRKRAEQFFRIVAVDGPTGLHLGPDEAVQADLTLCIGVGKTDLFREENADAVGRIELVPIFGPPFPALDEVALERSWLRTLLPRRRPRSHKTKYGRLVIVGGSRGTSGAPLISATGALRTGAGLVHIAVRSEVLAEAVPRAPIDAMVLAAGDGASFSALLEKADVVALGPGLGTDYDASELIRRILSETKAPLVIDADALTLLAKHADLLAACRGRALLTPHPGEMGRFPGLGGKFGEEERPEVARQFVAAYGVVLLLKGTRTLVAAPGEPLAVNTTGNPGLAAGGSGDLLTGVVAALAGQGLTLADAARLGAWLHGRAADLALRSRGAEEGLGPLEVADHLAAAFADLRG